jgi:hypothetical protein
MKTMIEMFIKTIAMLVLVGILYQPVTYAGTKVPDVIEMELGFIVVNSSTVMIALRYTPNEDILNKPPEFTLEWGETNAYSTSAPLRYDNAIDENGIIQTIPLVIEGLKADTVYHYHIIMHYLGITFDTDDDNFKTAGSI